MKTLFLILAVMFLAIGGIAIRLFFIKNGNVRGGCAGKNPLLVEKGASCSMCGAKPEEVCLKPEDTQG